MPASPNNASNFRGYIVPDESIVAAPPEDWEFSKQLYDLITGTSGLTNAFARWQMEPGGIPGINVDWASYTVTSVENEWDAYQNHIGRKFVNGVEQPFEGETILEDMEHITVLIAFYGQNAGKFASRFKHGLQMAQNREEAGSRGISVIGTGTTLTLPEQINDRWYMRKDVELYLSRRIDRVYLVRNLLSASFTFQGDAGGREPHTYNGNVDENTF